MNNMEIVGQLENISINNWDHYYYLLSVLVAQNSRCLSTKIGAVLVKDKSIISTGYNGPPRGIPHCDVRCNSSPHNKVVFDSKLENDLFVAGYRPSKVQKLDNCPRRLLGYKSGEGLEYCIAGHAERNALLNAARHGISTYDTTLYLSCGVPCKDCLIEIINAGVKEVVVVDKYNFYDETSKYIKANSNLTIRNYCLESENETKR